VEEQKSGCDRPHREGVPNMGSTTMTSWREVGRCKGVDPEVFYPDDDEDPGEEAKAICSMCMVRETCLEQAIVSREKIGVWGGYTARERRRLIRQLRRRAS